MDPAGDAEPRRPRLVGSLLAGALAAACALAVAELLAGAVGAISSPVELIGDRVVDLAPPAVKDAAVAVLGAADKLALQVGTVVIALAIGAALGAVGRIRWTAATYGFAAAGLLGVLAASADPRVSILLVVMTIGGGVLAGLMVLSRLLVAYAGAGSASAAEMPTRRRLLVAAGVGAAAVLGGATGRWLLRRSGVDEARAAITLPPAASSAGVSMTAARRLRVEGLSPLFTPNDVFYRIDTALRVPQIEPRSWRLRVTGLVDRELSFTFDELRSRATVEADITIACVSNEIGGDLVGNARWQGVVLRDLLEEAGIDASARQVVGRAVDDFTAAFPVAAAIDGRNALVALGMNGAPLPIEHGFPARLVVPGLYGYVSATKWLGEIELVDDSFLGYWVPRGWAKLAPIKSQSRIDVPRPNSEVPAGRVTVAGVAWAPTRGISAVDVRVGDGPWEPAELGPGIGDDAWRQWVHRWDARPGRYRLQVRATNGDGHIQTAHPAPPRPDGATGHHTITVNVAAR